jgi:hypothetical protein
MPDVDRPRDAGEKSSMRIPVAALACLLSASCGKDGARDSDGYPNPSDAGGIAHPVVVIALSESSLPDVVVEGETLHVAWVTNGNVVYGQYRKDGELSKHPVRVNEEYGTVTGGMYRGPDLDLGKDGRVHVAWYPNAHGEDANAEHGLHYAYADTGSTFTSPMNLSQGLSDNYAMAADGNGKVEAIWSANDQLFARTSTNGGETWGPATPFADVVPCECCGTRIEYAPGGERFVLYRDKAENIRDINLLVGDGPRPARSRLATETWQAEQCPMSGSYVAPAGDSLAAAWRTKGAIEFVQFDALGEPRHEVQRIEGEAGVRFPVVLVSADGTTLVAYKSADVLHWRIYGPDGKLSGESGTRQTETPDRPAGGALSDGTFVLFG